MSHPSQTPQPRQQAEAGLQYTGYGYGGQPIDPRTGQPVWPGYTQGGYVQAPEKNSNGLAIGSLILGIVGLALSWIPIINYIAVVLGIIGLVLGGIGIFKSNRLMSIAGAVVSLIAIVASFMVFASFANAVDDAVNDVEQSTPVAPELQPLD